MDVGGPLHGIRIVEMAHMISGPYAGMLLADMGADVVKVEMPGRGDIFRAWDGSEGGISPQFAAYNRGKRSIVLDVRTERGKDAFLRLCDRSDVVLENFRPGVLDRMGVGYQVQFERNPAIIFCSVTGMGSTGPYRDQPTYNTIAQAISGLTSQLTDMSHPEATGPTFSDQITSLFAALAIVGALQHRHRTGTGQRLEVSMLESALAFQASAVSDFMMQGIVADQLSTSRLSQAYAFIASDGLPFAIHLSTPQRFWQATCEVVGHPEWVDDARFRIKPDRIRNYEVLRGELAEAFAARPRDEWIATLRERDVPVAPVNTIGEALEDPQVRHLDLLHRFEAPTGTQHLVGAPFRMEGSPCTPSSPCPTLGEHTGAVLSEIGLSKEEIEDIERAQ